MHSRTTNKVEILMKRAGMFAGYLNSPDPTKSVVDAESWVHSGYIGYFDDDGCLYVVEQIKKIMLYRNEKRRSKDLVSSSALSSAFQLERRWSFSKKWWSTLLCRTSPFPDHRRLRGGLYFVDSLPMTSSGKLKLLKAKKIVTELFKQRN